MAVSKITIKNGLRDGVPTERTVLSSGFKVRGLLDVEEGVDQGSIRLTASDDPRQATIQCTVSAVEVDVDAAVAQISYVSRINGVSPMSDGTFMLHGSACTSWFPAVSVDSVPEIHLVDLCPACRTCDAEVALKKQVEYLKILMNSLKDTSLYPQATLNARKTYLTDSRFVVSETCTAALQNTPAALLVPPDFNSVQLLGQYVTMVHMWNFIASQNNSSTVLTTAPEDSAGITVSTKRALPACDGLSSLNCTIKLTLSSGQSGLSVYVPDPITDFIPFGGGCQQYANAATVSHASTVCTTKTVSASFPDVNCAGTYCVVAKFLPFYNSTLLDEDGDPVTIARIFGAPKNPVPAAGNLAQDVYNFNATYSATPKQAPTLDDFTRSRSHPSRSATGRNRWQVVITWTSTGAFEHAATETYMYEGNGVRTWLDSIMSGSSYAILE